MSYIPRIFVLEPRASNFWVLLVYLKTEIVEVFLELVGHQEARGPSADTDDTNMSLGVDGTSEPPASIVVLWARATWEDKVCHFQGDLNGSK